MAFEIDIRSLEEAVNAILDHLTDDLGIRTLAIEKGDDFYWECPAPERFDMSKQPIGLEVGQLSDDVDFEAGSSEVRLEMRLITWST